MAAGDAPFPCRGRPGGDCDVVIVGAGISGAMLAHRLRDRGDRVLVVDRRPPLHGSTAASTALLQFEIDTPLFDLARSIGRERAERAWRRSAAAVGHLRALVRRERIRCAWRDARTLYLAGDAYGRVALRREADARAAAGVPGDFLDAAALADDFGIERTGAILSDGSAAADPVRLAAGLLRRAASAGVRVCSPVEIVDIAETSRGVTLMAADGARIEAARAVFCTGYEVPKAVPRSGHRIKSTWAIASAPGVVAPAWLADHLVWEAADPYLYLRLTADGRIVAGGEDEPWSDAHADRRLLQRKTATIAAKVRALLPGIRFRIAQRWAGAFGETPTGLPVIDRLPGHRRCWTVMGFGGNGITYAMIASEVVAAAIAGRPDPDADLYRLP
ncbi:MAG: NAD(P)/FAD-dependent oxidoreductase [Alphaproteobacteria bacterium]